MKKWEIMKAFEEGAEIESRAKSDNNWYSDDMPGWNWTLKDYRVKPQKWQPQGDNYIVASHGVSARFTSIDAEDARDFGIMFKTLEDAEKAYIEFRKFHRLYQIALDLNEGWEPDWGNLKQRKYFIVQEHQSGKWLVEEIICNYQSHPAYFKSSDVARSAINLIENGALE